MTRRQPTYRQRSVTGGRESLPSCVLDSIYDRVDAEAKKYSVSRSFVIATALAHVFGINEDDQEDYKTVATRRVKTHRKNGKPT